MSARPLPNQPKKEIVIARNPFETDAQFLARKNLLEKELKNVRGDLSLTQMSGRGTQGVLDGFCQDIEKTLSKGGGALSPELKKIMNNADVFSAEMVGPDGKKHKMTVVRLTFNLPQDQAAYEQFKRASPQAD